MTDNITQEIGEKLHEIFEAVADEKGMRFVTDNIDRVLAEQDIVANNTGFNNLRTAAAKITSEPLRKHLMQFNLVVNAAIADRHDSESRQFLKNVKKKLARKYH